jgi:membrane carboxypeptidase/penicillin-binding protein PbpC
MKTTAQIRQQIAQTLMNIRATLSAPRQPKPVPECLYIVLGGNELSLNQQAADLAAKARRGDPSRVVYITSSGKRFEKPRMPIYLVHTDGTRETIYPPEKRFTAEEDRELAKVFAWYMNEQKNKH